MLDECVLDLDRTHPQSSDLEHVVGSTRIAEIAGLILRVLVAGPQPLALEGILRPFVLVPVERTRRIAANPQVANLARCDRNAGIVENPRVVSADHDAARARTALAGPVRDEHVERFG